LWMLAAIYAVVFLTVTLATGSQHDYQAYVRIWSRMLDGGEPWPNPISLNDNTYGPLFNAFALVFAISPLAPKFLFALAWLGGQWLVFRRLMNPPANRALLWFAVIALNPFPWVWVAGYGNNDAVMAFLLALAVWRLLSASNRIGIEVGSAALLKYYPLLLLPFMCTDRGAIRLRPLLTGLAIFLAGMLIAFAIWGPIALAPILAAEYRGAKLLSIYAFLQDSTLVPAMELRQNAFVQKLPSILFALVGLGGMIFHVWSRQSWFSGMIFAYFIVLLCYQVGHFQFYLPLLLIFPVYAAYLVEHHRNSAESRQTVFVIALALAYVSILGAAYWPLGAYYNEPWLAVRQNCGLFAFILNAAVIVQLMRTAIRHRRDGLPG
jgi:hypothetical protein